MVRLSVLIALIAGSLAGKYPKGSFKPKGMSSGLMLKESFTAEEVKAWLAEHYDTFLEADNPNLAKKVKSRGFVVSEEPDLDQTISGFLMETGSQFNNMFKRVNPQITNMYKNILPMISQMPGVTKTCFDEGTDDDGSPGGKMNLDNHITCLLESFLDGMIPTEPEKDDMYQQVEARDEL